MPKFYVGDMVQGNKDSHFLRETIEGRVVKITHSAGSNPITNQVCLCLVQDKDGANYNYVDERWLEASDAPEFQPKELREGSIVTLSPHSNKEVLDRETNYSVKKVENDIATIIVRDEEMRIHVEDLQIIR